MAYQDTIKISMPAPSRDYSDGDMMSFAGKFKKAEQKERAAALKKRERNINTGTWIQFTLTLVCLWQAARYAYYMNDSDGGTRIGGWSLDGWGYDYVFPSISINALLMILGVLGMVASGTFFAARMPELVARFKLAVGGAAKAGVAMVMAMHIVAICASSAVSLYTSQSIIQFSSQAATDVSETAGDKATAALGLKDQYGRDLVDLENEILTAKDRLRVAEAADQKHVASAINYPQADRGWVLNFENKGGLRKPFYDAVIGARATLAALEAERAGLKRGQRAATATYRDAIEAPNSIERSLEEQGKMYGGVTPERINLVISQIASALIEFFRITLSITSQTSLAHAIIGFALSEHHRRSKEAAVEREAEDRQRRIEEATMAPVRAKEDAHLRLAEAHAERIKARADASVAAVSMDEEPDDLIRNTDAVAALEETPDGDALAIPPMPSERPAAAPTAPFSATRAVDSIDGYDGLSAFYQEAVRRAELAWRGGAHHLTANAIKEGYGIKSNDARLVFLRWLEETGRARGHDGPTGRKYTKVRIAA